ncbi:Holliday junction branch migration protein RuvA [Elusimicrobiota bacterium]
MIAYIKGVLVNKSQSEAWVETGGIAYAINIAPSTSKELKSGESEIKLFISESASMYGGEKSLYGFLSVFERDLFEALRSLPNVGAKKALEFFEKAKAKSIENFLSAVRRKDTRLLCSMFGFREKTATRLIQEMAEKLDKLTSGSPLLAKSSAIRSSGSDIPGAAISIGANYDKALSALIHLGYRSHEARAVLEDIMQTEEKQPEKPEELVRMALRRLQIAI